MCRVLVFNEQKDLSIKASSVKAVVKSLLADENFLTDELSIYFVTTEKIAELHQEFFNDPTPTDAISLPLDGVNESSSNYHILGEIFVCPQIAIDYVKNHPQQAESCPHSETTLYLVHGLLHLLGYDDIDPKERKKMQKVQEHHMKLLKTKNVLLVPNRANLYSQLNLK